ncbi:MAG: hypothetical protein ACRCTW_10890 [Lactococcus garvieae]
MGGDLLYYKKNAVKAALFFYTKRRHLRISRALFTAFAITVFNGIFNLTRLI